MKPRITQNELARKLGISRSTVAAALNPNSPIRLTEETRRRVVEAAKKWNYRPDPFALVMRGGRSGRIGLLHFGGLLQVAAERAFYATAAVQRAGFEIVSADLSWSVEASRSACLSMIDARVEGVIVAGLNNSVSLESLELFRRADIPGVALSGNPLAWAPHFRGDASRAYADLTRHLLKLGHRRLVLLLQVDGNAAVSATYNYAWSSKERIRGFEAALRAKKGRIVSAYRGGDPSAPLGIVCHAPFSDELFNPFEAGRRGMFNVLDLPIRPTAVLCSNDEAAYGAMQACRERNVSVPREIALTGYDDIALGRCCEIPLTTVRQPNKAMAEAAVHALLRRLERSAPSKANLERVFRCDLIVRKSCGFPEGGGPGSGPADIKRP